MSWPFPRWWRTSVMSWIGLSLNKLWFFFIRYGIGWSSFNSVFYALMPCWDTIFVKNQLGRLSFLIINFTYISRSHFVICYSLFFRTSLFQRSIHAYVFRIHDWFYCASHLVFSILIRRMVWLWKQSVVIILRHGASVMTGFETHVVQVGVHFTHLLHGKITAVCK